MIFRLLVSTSSALLASCCNAGNGSERRSLHVEKNTTIGLPSPITDQSCPDLIPTAHRAALRHALVIRRPEHDTRRLGHPGGAIVLGRRPLLKIAGSATPTIMPLAGFGSSRSRALDPLGHLLGGHAKPDVRLIRLHAVPLAVTDEAAARDIGNRPSLICPPMHRERRAAAPVERAEPRPVVGEGSRHYAMPVGTELGEECSRND